MPSVNESIDWFDNFFRNELEMVASTRFTRRESVHKRLLFCCLIDAMSDAVDLPCLSPKGSHTDNKKRFLEGIRLYGKWPACSKVSRPYLESLLSKTTDSAFDKVKDYISQKPNWPNQVIVDTKHDLRFKDLDLHWPRDKNEPKKIAETRLADLRHDHLLYYFRNKLVHETREVNQEYDTRFDDMPASRPFYHKGLDWTQNPPSDYWALTHPPKFVEKLAFNILRGLVADCRRRQLDPVKRLSTEPYWSER